MAQESTVHLPRTFENEGKNLYIENTPMASNSRSAKGMEHEKQSDAPTIDPEQSAGVQKMEAITIVWTKPWLITAFVLYVSA